MIDPAEKKKRTEDELTMELYDQHVNREKKLSLIGLGYVGMPIAAAFAKKLTSSDSTSMQKRLRWRP